MLNSYGLLLYCTPLAQLSVPLGFKPREKGSQSWTVAFDFELAPGTAVNIHALDGVNDASNLYSGFSGNIWNNSKSDPAILIAPDGTRVSRYP